MVWRSILVAAIGLTLSGCSYVYDLLAVMRDGQLMFVVDPNSQSQPDCFRQIEVVSVQRAAVEASPGDDQIRTGYGTVWRDEVEYEDECENQFPFAYGRTLDGDQRADHGLVRPKPLARGVVYEVTTVTGATGYGGGRFIVRTDGRVDNLPAS
jgi:hypothetical protein